MGECVPLTLHIPEPMTMSLLALGGMALAAAVEAGKLD